MHSKTNRVRCGSETHRSGVTLVEALVVISIIGLLAGIILPAVQTARSASYRYQCANNQRQLILATSSYHDVFGVFPPLSPMSSGDCVPPTPINRLFPYLELPDVCSVLRSNVKRLPILECPADGDIGLMTTPLSYSVNVSPGIGSGVPFAGPYDLMQVVSARDITDGLSSTAGISENLVVRAGGSPAEADRDPVRYYWAVSVPSLSAAATPQEISAQTELSIEECEQGPRTFLSVNPASGGQWGPGIFGAGGAWTYTHWLSPNAPWCGVAGLSMGRQPFLIDNRRSASGHTGGVNVAYMDGHQRFVSNQVDQTAWRAAGTRNGNEAIGE